jgi:serine/threonine protein kinase
MDFLRRLLIKDPNLRMSTAVALAHPFISGALSASVEVLQAQAQASAPVATQFSVSSSNSGPIVGPNDPAEISLMNPGHMSPAGGESNLHSNFSFTPRSFMVHQQQRQHQEFLLHTPAAQNLSYTPGSFAAKAAAQVAAVSGSVCTTGRFSTSEADVIVTCITNFVLADPLIKLTALMIAHSIPPEDVSCTDFIMVSIS